MKILHNNEKAGFTLIELMIGIAVSIIVLIMIYALNEGIQRQSMSQVRIAVIQQNLRGGITILERDLRCAGLEMPNPNNSFSKVFGITDIRKYSITDQANPAAPDVSGSPALIFSADLNNNNVLDADETVSYMLYDKDADGRSHLARDNGAGRQLLAENIERIGFAYALDANRDNEVDRDAGEIIWAIDSDNDNRLDQQLLIDETTAVITMVALPTSVAPERIKMVRIWLLARDSRVEKGYHNTHIYYVGNAIPDQPNDAFKRRIIDQIVYARNS